MTPLERVVYITGERLNFWHILMVKIRAQMPQAEHV